MHIQNLPPWQASRFSIERTAELEKLSSMLDTFGYVFIKGMGGLGKSELAKLFVKRYKDKFSTIQFCKYVDSLKSLVAAMPVVGIDDIDYKNHIDDLFRAKNKVLHQSDSRTLIIVDNFNVTFDKQLREFLPNGNSGFKVIFTTRCMPAPDYCQEQVYQLPPLSKEECRSLFHMYSNLTLSSAEQSALDELIDEIQANTLLLTLIAKAISKTSLSIQEIIIKLRTQELSSVNTKVFHDYDYPDQDIEVYSKITSHLAAVFSLSSLTKNEREAILDMTLISPYGIQKIDFLTACSSDSITANVVDSIEAKGWIENKNEYIFMHPIVSDVVSENEKNKPDSYYDLAEYLEDTCDIDCESHILEIHKALAAAKQLERRYKNENIIFQAFAAFFLGNIYLALFMPKESKTYLQRAYNWFDKYEEYDMLPIVCFKLGNYEFAFGTKDKAMFYYDMTLRLSDNSSLEHNIISANALLEIAACYEENNEKIRALEEYKELLDYVFEHDLTEYIDLESVAEESLYLAEELGLDDETALLKDFFKENNIKFENSNSIWSQIRENKFEKDQLTKSMKVYEDTLQEIKEELGENSPYYKDLSKYRWIYSLINNETEKAEEQIQETMTFLETSYGKNSMEIADFCALLSAYMLEMNENDYANELALRAIRICKTHSQTDSYVYLKANMDLCGICICTGDINRALSIIESLDLDMEKYSGTEYLSDMISRLGIVYLELNMYDKALELAKMVIENKSTDRFSRIVAFEIIFIYYVSMNNVEAAENWLSIIENEVSSLEKLTYFAKYLLLYDRMAAKLYSLKGDHQKAVEYLCSAIELYSGIDPKSYFLFACYMERALYYIYLKENTKAMMDFRLCEELIDKYKITGKYLLSYYNNRGILCLHQHDYEQAENYYKKIFNANPMFEKPESILEAIVFQNYSLVELYLDKPKKCEKYIRLSLEYYENNSLMRTREYTNAKLTLFNFLSSQGRHKENLDLALWLYDYYTYLVDATHQTYIDICAAIVLGYIFTDRTAKAYAFAMKEEKFLAQKYGKLSVERITFLQNISSVFKYCGYIAAFDFLLISKKLIIKANLTRTIYQAMQDNFAGVIFLDINENPSLAAVYFEDAKELMEEIGQQDNPFYPVICENLKKAEQADDDVSILFS